eukprot:5889183-Amphidinium_carterae.1
MGPRWQKKVDVPPLVDHGFEHINHPEIKISTNVLCSSRMAPPCIRLGICSRCTGDLSSIAKQITMGSEVCSEALTSFAPCRTRQAKFTTSVILISDDSTHHANEHRDKRPVAVEEASLDSLSSVLAHHT